jgi:hypothetical protein
MSLDRTATAWGVDRRDHYRAVQLPAVTKLRDITAPAALAALAGGAGVLIPNPVTALVDEHDVMVKIAIGTAIAGLAVLVSWLGASGIRRQRLRWARVVSTAVASALATVTMAHTSLWIVRIEYDPVEYVVTGGGARLPTCKCPPELSSAECIEGVTVDSKKVATCWGGSAIARAKAILVVEYLALCVCLATMAGLFMIRERSLEKLKILFLAANPTRTPAGHELGRLALDEEERAIRKRLEDAGAAARFELVTRWAVRPSDLLDQLERLQPAVVHFSAHGSNGALHLAESQPVAATRDIATAEPGSGFTLFLQGDDGAAVAVSGEALTTTFGAIGRSVQMVVLAACYSEAQASALTQRVDAVVGMDGAIRDDVARVFAAEFYRALSDGKPLADAIARGRVAVSLAGLPDPERVELKVREGLDPKTLVIAPVS